MVSIGTNLRLPCWLCSPCSSCWSCSPCSSCSLLFVCLVRLVTWPSAMSGRLSSFWFSVFFGSLECLLIQKFWIFPLNSEFRIQNSLLLHVLHWRISRGSLQRRSLASSPRSSAATWGDENRDFNLKQFARNRVDKANLAKQLKRLLPFEANKFDSLVNLSTGESTGQSLNWPQLKCGQQIVRSMRSHRIVWGMETHWIVCGLTESFEAVRRSRPSPRRGKMNLRFCYCS